MIEEKLVVSDSNIFFDLIEVNLLDAFFRLPCKIVTTDFVINEIVHPRQKAIIDGFVRLERLQVVSFDAGEFSEVMNLFSKSRNNTSITDCTVWYHARRTGGRLLTGDAKLRKSAEFDRVKVSGILYIFDNIVEYGICDKKTCAGKLRQLLMKNHRLPERECRRRIDEWGSS